MKKNNTTRKQLFVVIKKTRSFAKKTEITSQSQQNTSTTNNPATGYSNAPLSGLENIRLSAPESGVPAAPATASSQPTPPAAPPAPAVTPLPKFNAPHAETATPSSQGPAQPSASSVPQTSQSSSAPAPVTAATTTEPAVEPAAPQEPSTPPFAPDYAAAGSQLSKLMSGMAAPLSRLAGTVPELLSSASASLTQAAQGKPNVTEAKPASVEPQAAPPDVKPIEVDVKLNTIAPTSSPAESASAAAPLAESSTTSAPKPIATVTWNPATTISALQRNAKKESIGYCARAVVNAIQAGGTKIERAPAAKDLGSKLIAAGFSPLFSMPRPSREYDSSKLLPGDVVILEGFKQDIKAGIKKDHPFGHAAMYDGSKWISDFTQSGFYPGPDYRKALPGYTIYRMVPTQAQIDDFNASQGTKPVSQTPVTAPSVTVTRPVPTTQATQLSASAPASRPVAQASRSAVSASHPETTESLSLPTAPIRIAAQSEHTEGVSAQETDNQTLTVLKGKVTYDAEGSEDRGKYFSRHIHFPETKESGVTLGRGYDMGQRTKKQVYNDLIAAGIPASQASKISSAAGKTGEQARKFVNENNDIGEITMEQQIKLFNNIYPIYEKKAQELYKKNTSGMSSVTKWENLNPAIKDILVDIVYQGFQGVQAMPAASQNSIDQFIIFLKNNEDYQKYENGRHRVDYLQKEKNRISRNQNN
ncbi:pesticin C-terminus-like muramidase [Dickeya poaceiphila]|uniref:Pesticin C-terminal domain-containing protein n=1 Tax=Dickeya poaceiphila TaxID=568768 RepID=A0A5B8IAD2_9GAMM|nr:pesticin C-terminus-like muramidase [Dickeya poaceiphila]QDX29837.1 hypothetical protein Dpoa569_0001659 [Dickeya poaceiphila]